MTPIQRILALWKIDMLSTEFVISWADNELLQADNPSKDLIALSLDGPEKCLKLPIDDFPSHPVRLTFLEEFSIRAIATNLQSDSSTLIFAKWVSRYAMGENLEDPAVMLGYQVDHLLNDCENSKSAIQFVIAELSPMLPRCKAIASSFLDLVPNLSFNPDATSSGHLHHRNAPPR